MKALFPLLLLSAALTAQKKENLILIPKTDTVKIVSKGKFPGYLALKSDQSQTGLYKMLIKKPNDTILYLALKEPTKDYSQYKILNAITPDKLQINQKKLIPSK
ncbi:type II secretory pathway component PulL [Chryseobacterium sediminis]|uniref:Type II secretory pathway component PulL n=1 Tax=Chryseobacterium sediminis TaxID=1679494 RepID=A0ABR6PWF0_9FLAO|nr:hypothetical protein [Chryseobacterium sediminis]MBB6330037.1 type II secretory pathway component PulL [Chryseobacterium sediminis]